MSTGLLAPRELRVSSLAVSEAVGYPVTGVGNRQRSEGTLQLVVSRFVEEVAEP